MRKKEITLDAAKLSLEKPVSPLASKVHEVLKKMQRAAGELYSEKNSRRLRDGGTLFCREFEDVGAFVYKATRAPENTVQWEEKDQTERRISSKDTQNRTGSRV